MIDELRAHLERPPPGVGVRSDLDGISVTLRIVGGVEHRFSWVDLLQEEGQLLTHRRRLRFERDHLRWLGGQVAWCDITEIHLMETTRRKRFHLLRVRPLLRIQLSTRTGRVPITLPASSIVIDTWLARAIDLGRASASSGEVPDELTDLRSRS